MLGCGIDRDYPAAHAELARSIVATGGLIVSEYEPGVDPAPWRFPARNRIIAGLARATVVVEARERSGALITADFALEDGREVLVVPGEITSALSAGANGLLRQGATPVTCAADVLEAVGVEPVSAAPVIPDAAGAAAVVEALSDGAATPDELVRGDIAAGGRRCRGTRRARARGRGRGGGGGGAQYDRAVTPTGWTSPLPRCRPATAGVSTSASSAPASRAAHARSRSPRRASACASSTSGVWRRARAAATADSRSVAWPAPTTRSSRITAGIVRSRCGAGRRPSSPRWHVSRATRSAARQPPARRRRRGARGPPRGDRGAVGGRDRGRVDRRPRRRARRALHGGDPTPDRRRPAAGALGSRARVARRRGGRRARRGPPGRTTRPSSTPRPWSLRPTGTPAASSASSKG